MPQDPASIGVDEAGRKGDPKSMLDQPTVVSRAIEPATEPERLAAARARIAEEGESGQFVAFAADDGFSIVRIPDGWSRIGRSASADIRLDDPTVSRRHALLVHRPGGRLSVLDDRSLNGVFVNGERAEWSELTDGDELGIGRYRLHVICTATP